MQVQGQLSIYDLLEESRFITELPQFAECIDCWCHDCRFNELNEAVPRDFAGEMKPCPACASCLEGGSAELCEIGSYDNGCKTRALDEGHQP